MKHHRTRLEAESWEKVKVNFEIKNFIQSKVSSLSGLNSKLKEAQSDSKLGQGLIFKSWINSWVEVEQESDPKLFCHDQSSFGYLGLEIELG